MAALYLIATIAGQRVALVADAVESVVEIEEMTPVPLAPPHVAGLAALRSRVLTTIDSLAALELGRMAAAPLHQAIVVAVDGHLYGILVDQVDDVATIEAAPQPVRGSLGAGWAVAARGVLDGADGPVLLIDPAVLVAGTAPAAAA